MHFSEDDLRAAMRRKDPGPEFTARVMAAVEHGRQKSGPGEMPGKSRWWPFRFAPALAGALAALVLAAGGWLEYHRYQHSREMARAERARQEAILALKITSAKLDHIFRRVNQQEPPQPKTRRESL
jgi:hypothetical protein